jgi:hypothetical protein
MCGMFDGLSGGGGLNDGHGNYRVAGSPSAVRTVEGEYPGEGSKTSSNNTLATFCCIQQLAQSILQIY